MSIRKTVVASSFYPNDKDELLSLIKSFSFSERDKDFKEIKAIIVPHAGYVYSGEIANLAYKQASSFTYRRVVVIGPSHHAYLKGASVCLDEFYETPLGNIEIDLKFSKEIMSKYDFLDNNLDCAFEHSTETQAPFIKHYFKNSKLVEIVYGDLESKHLKILINDILSSRDNLLIISSDLSHFHNLEEAKKIDDNCLEAIKNIDLKLLDLGEACGKIGIKALLQSIKGNSLKTKLLAYKTSFDVNKNKQRVVGYTSALIGK